MKILIEVDLVKAAELIRSGKGTSPTCTIPVEMEIGDAHELIEATPFNPDGSGPIVRIAKAHEQAYKHFTDGIEFARTLSPEALASLRRSLPAHG